MLARPAHRHRDQRADRAVRDALASRLEQVAQPARDDRQHDVVDRAAERGPHGLDVAQAHVRPAPGAVRPDRPGQRRAAAAGAARARSRPCRGAVSSPARATRAARASPRAAVRSCSDGLRVRRVIVRMHELRRRSARGRAATGAVRLRRSLLPEHHRHQVGRRDAVDHAVVDLREQRPAVLAQSLEHPDLPERLGAVEALGEDPRGRAPQLLVAAGRRQGAVAQVVGEVEVRVVHPDRAAEAERDEADLLAVARDEAQLARRPSPRAARTAAPAPRRCSPRRCASGCMGPSMCRNEASIGLIQSIGASCGRGSGEHPVDLARSPTCRVARLHLDVLRATGRGRPPRRRFRRFASRSTPRAPWRASAPADPRGTRRSKRRRRTRSRTSRARRGRRAAPPNGPSGGRPGRR